MPNIFPEYKDVKEDIKALFSDRRLKNISGDIANEC